MLALPVTDVAGANVVRDRTIGRTMIHENLGGDLEALQARILTIRDSL